MYSREDIRTCLQALKEPRLNRIKEPSNTIAIKPHHKPKLLWCKLKDSSLCSFRNFVSICPFQIKYLLEFRFMALSPLSLCDFFCCCLETGSTNKCFIVPNFARCLAQAILFRRVPWICLGMKRDHDENCHNQIRFLHYPIATTARFGFFHFPINNEKSWSGWRGKVCENYGGNICSIFSSSLLFLCPCLNQQQFFTRKSEKI